MKREALKWFLTGLGLLMFVGCGEEVATPNGKIVGPGDSEVTFLDSPGFLGITAGPLEFQVFQPADTPDEAKPMPGVTVRFFGGGQVVALTDRDGNDLNPNDPLFFETETDDRGLSPTDVYAVYFVPRCKANPADPTQPGDDIVVTGEVMGTVGVDSDTWTINITAQGGLPPTCS